ncbi:MAG: hypothetical protein MZW92_67850 [Comamonadaceae bacterium]|nr:hypothetical protein [Comamonadaceae bacterium]
MPTAHSHLLRGIALFLAAMLLFATLDATAKHLSATFPVPMLVWARYTFHFLLMVVFLAPSLRSGLIRTRHPGRRSCAPSCWWPPPASASPP